MTERNCQMVSVQIVKFFQLTGRNFSWLDRIGLADQIENDPMLVNLFISSGLKNISGYALFRKTEEIEVYFI